MNKNPSRRGALRAAGLGAALAALPRSGTAAEKVPLGMEGEGPDTRKFASNTARAGFPQAEPQTTSASAASNNRDQLRHRRDVRNCGREGAHTLDEMWTNITYFLKAVIPVAEKANVRLARIRTIRRHR